jgi:hypothetical protein
MSRLFLLGGQDVLPAPTTRAALPAATPCQSAEYPGGYHILCILALGLLLLRLLRLLLRLLLLLLHVGVCCAGALLPHQPVIGW